MAFDTKCLKSYNLLMSTTNKKHRLFLAIDINSATLNALAETTDKLRELFPEANWCKCDAMHLTLKFFGTMPYRHISVISGIIKPVLKKTKPFCFSANGIGAFPALGNPRVIWVGVEQGKQEIEELADNIFTALEENRFGKHESKRFIPHITLARFNKKQKTSEKTIETVTSRFNNMTYGITKVNKLSLYSSDLTAKGPVYTVVDNFDLG